jgi:thymidylate kinase
MDRGNVKKPLYILIAGPQASGKSTAVRLLGEILPGSVIHNECGAFVLSSMRDSGGAFVTEEMERKILECEFAKLCGVAEGIHVDETGVFSLAHARGLGFGEMADEFLPRILDELEKFDVRIVFIDTDPDVSWDRRKHVYIDRGFLDDEMQEARAKIDRTYGELKKLYEELSFEKVLIENNSSDLGAFRGKIEKTINHFLE